MKNLMLVFGIIFLSLSVQAKHLVSEKTVDLPVDISTAGVRFSASGYSMYLVKVLVPGLAEETVLDHRNEGEAAPCMATWEIFSADELIQGHPGVEVVPVTIKVTRHFHVQDGICQGLLKEDIRTTIRGVRFSHLKTLALPSRHVDDCK